MMWEDMIDFDKARQALAPRTVDMQLQELMRQPGWTPNPKFRQQPGAAPVIHGSPGPGNPFEQPGIQITPTPPVGPNVQPGQPVTGESYQNNFLQDFGQRLAGGMRTGASAYGAGVGAGDAVASMVGNVSPVNLDASVTGARPYNSLDTGMQASPFMQYNSLLPEGPVHTLGVNGFRTGWSRPTVDYSGVMDRARVDNHNMQMAQLLGRQDIARNAQMNENMRTMMGVQQRDEAMRAMGESRYFGNLNRVPEGKRSAMINEGLSRGYVDPTVGADMLLDEMLLRGKMNAKTGSGVDLGRLLGSVGAEFDPNKLSRLDLIAKLQRMGYTADQIAKYESDPVAGPFVRSLLNPAPDPRHWSESAADAIGYAIGSKR